MLVDSCRHQVHDRSSSQAPTFVPTIVRYKIKLHFWIQWIKIISITKLSFCWALRSAKCYILPPTTCSRHFSTLVRLCRVPARTMMVGLRSRRRSLTATTTQMLSVARSSQGHQGKPCLCGHHRSTNPQSVGRTLATTCMCNIGGRGHVVVGVVSLEIVSCL
jgi:hypothetical protein